MSREDAGLREQVLVLGPAARAAAGVLAVSEADQRNRALVATAEQLQARGQEIIAANEQDMEAARERGRPAAFLDRLCVDERRLRSMVTELHQVAELPDLLGEISDVSVRPNGLRIARMRMPIGVIGMIYEARPGVTIEAGGLCVKAGNAVILRSGTDALRTCMVLVQCMQQALQEADLPGACVQLVPIADRAAVDVLLGMEEWIDAIIPRGGTDLIERVMCNTQIPVLKHLHGICHVYLDDDAETDMAQRIAVNAKTQRYGVCNAMETLLVAASRAEELLPMLARAYGEHGVEIRGCPRTCALVPEAVPAHEEDWSTEYLGPVLSVKVVDGLDEAMRHIAHYGSQHTDAIVTENAEAAQRFLREVDSSSVLHNASTRFADGFEFGLGAEIGISTDRLHARGPLALEGLTNQKYIVRGTGQVRVSV